MAPKKKMSREEVLLKKRLKERERYKRMKDDPAIAEIQKERERIKYQNKKKKKQVKSIKSMTEREARMKRKQWKKNSKKYYNNKKRAIEGYAVPVSPPSSDNEVIQPIPAIPQQSSGRKRIHRDRSKVIQRNKKLLSENARLKTELEKYKKRYYRSVKSISSEEKDMTPRKKIRILLKTKNKKMIQKRLLFGTALEHQLKKNFESIQCPRVKKRFVCSVVGTGEILKRCKVVKELKMIFTKRLTRCMNNNIIKKRNQKFLAAQLQSDITKFLEDDHNSRLTPGKKDCVTHKKNKKQKRILNDTMQNLHTEFCKTVQYSISYSTFCKFRPFWIMYQKTSERDTCQCKIHANTSFIITALYKNKIIYGDSAKKIAEILCCDESYKLPCLLRTCPNCINKEITFSEFDGDLDINYYAWVQRNDEYKSKTGMIKTVNHTVKLQKVSSALQLVNNLKKIVERFMKHEAIILNQYSEIKFLKTCMKDDEFLLHVDFSENYALKYATEIQSFHFGGSRKQITLHTTSVSFRESDYGPVKTKSFCTLSDNLKHGPQEIFAHLMLVFNFVKSVNPNVKFLHFLSDSPSSQYRNKLMFYIFSHLIKEHFPSLQYSTWNYHEAGHGKGAPDGTGGTVKRTADKLVSEGKDIDSLEILTMRLKENLRKVEIEIINENDISTVTGTIDYDEVVPFKGTMNIHQVVQLHDFSKPITLQMKTMTCMKCMEIHRRSPICCEHFSLGHLQYKDNSCPEASIYMCCSLYQ